MIVFLRVIKWYLKHFEWNVIYDSMNDCDIFDTAAALVEEWRVSAIVSASSWGSE